MRTAARELAEADGTAPLDYWRALGTRCVTVIRRIRSATASEVVPEHFHCPISFGVMEDPVITRVGNTYDRHAIVRWNEGREIPEDPLTREPLNGIPLIPNRVIRDAIEHFMMNEVRFSVPMRLPQWAM